MRIAWVGVAVVAVGSACSGGGSSSSVPVGPSSVGDNGGGSAGSGGGGGAGSGGGGSGGGSGGTGGGGSGGVGGGGSGGVGGGGGGGSVCKLTAPVNLVSGLNAPKKIVVDATDVYYIDAAGPGGLYRVSKSGGNPTLLANVGSIQTDTWDWDVAVDDATIYLLHGGRQPNGTTVDAGTIELIPKNGAPHQTIVAASSSCHTAFPHKLAVVDGQLYWRQTDVVNPGVPACSGEAATYSIVAFDATTMQQTVVAQPASGNAFTADAFHLFWCDVDGTHRAPRSPGGSSETLAPLVLAEIVTDGNAIFGFANTNIEAITAPGQYRLIFGGTKQVLGLAVDDANVYFATFSGVHRMAKDGSNHQLFLIGEAAAVTVDANSVYYFSGSNLVTACK